VFGESIKKHFESLKEKGIDPEEIRNVTAAAQFGWTAVLKGHSIEFNGIWLTGLK